MAKAKLPMSVKEAAEAWGKSISWVKKMVKQGRVEHDRIGGGDERAGAILITQSAPPAIAAFGQLDPVQRAAWPKKAKAKVATETAKPRRKKVVKKAATA
jgi:hypothetical protein